MTVTTTTVLFPFAFRYSGQQIFLFSKHSKLLWAPASLLLSVHLGEGGRQWRFMDRNLVFSISISGAVPLLLYTASRRTERHLSCTASNCLSPFKSNVPWPSLCNSCQHQKATVQLSFHSSHTFRATDIMPATTT